MIKHKTLSMVIPVLLATGTANAAEVYNKDGNKLDLYGKADVLHLFSADKSEDGDESYIHFGFKGETQVNDELTGYGQWEYNIQANNAESKSSEGNATRLGFAGLKFTDYGSVDYGRNWGVLYDVMAWTDVLPVFGGNTVTVPDNYMTSRANNLATYRNSNFFGLIDGLSFALQYQGKNDNTNRTGLEQNGDGFGLSSIYEIEEGLSVGAAYTSSNRSKWQKDLTNGSALGNNAQAWSVGTKYDANNIYLAATYSETLNMTPFGVSSGKPTDSSSAGDNFIADKTQNIELVAQYQFDFGLRPSLAYLKSQGKDLNVAGADSGKADLVEYVDIASYYDFNKNMSAYVDYKVNLLKKNDFTEASGIATDNIVGVGMVYQF